MIMGGILSKPSISIGKMELIMEYMAGMDYFEPDLSAAKSRIREEDTMPVIKSKEPRADVSRVELLGKFKLAGTVGYSLLDAVDEQGTTGDSEGTTDMGSGEVLDISGFDGFDGFDGEDGRLEVLQAGSNGAVGIQASELNIEDLDVDDSGIEFDDSELGDIDIDDEIEFEDTDVEDIRTEHKNEDMRQSHPNQWTEAESEAKEYALGIEFNDSDLELDEDDTEFEEDGLKPSDGSENPMDRVPEALDEDGEDDDLDFEIEDIEEYEDGEAEEDEAGEAEPGPESEEGSIEASKEDTDDYGDSDDYGDFEIDPEFDIEDDEDEEDEEDEESDGEDESKISTQKELATIETASDTPDEDEYDLEDYDIDIDEDDEGEEEEKPSKPSEASRVVQSRRNQEKFTIEEGDGEDEDEYDIDIDDGSEDEDNEHIEKSVQTIKPPSKHIEAARSIDDKLKAMERELELLKSANAEKERAIAERDKRIAEWEKHNKHSSNTPSSTNTSKVGVKNSVDREVNKVRVEHGAASKQNVTEARRKVAPQQPKKPIPSAAPPSKKDHVQERVKMYSSMSIDALYDKVKTFMYKNGLRHQPVNPKLLTDEFGKDNIQKLINRGSLIILKGKGVTTGI